MAHRTGRQIYRGVSMKGYCMKCRSERDIAEATTVYMKNGRPATEGKCPQCGTRMYRLGKAA